MTNAYKKPKLINENEIWVNNIEEDLKRIRNKGKANIVDCKKMSLNA